jgi:HEAT repeat protein
VEQIWPHSPRPLFANNPHRFSTSRNACIVLGNRGDRAAIPALVAAANDPESLIRDAASWALGKLG